MSFAVTEWVVKKCHQTGSKRLTLMVLAFYSDDKGECFPSLETLSKGVGVTERQMRVILRDLENLGEIETISGGGRRTNTYRILGYLRHLKSATPSVEGQATTPVIHNPPHAENHPSGGLSTTPLTGSTQTDNVSKTTPLGGSGQPLWGEVGNPSGGLSTTPELTYNIDSSTIEETKPIKSNVTTVGGDTAQTHLPESTQPLQPTQSGETSVSQSSEPTGITDQPATPVNVAVEGMPTNSDKNKLNSKSRSKPTPPIVPPVADSSKVRTLSDHQRMVSEIAKAFGWDFATMTKSNKKLVGKVGSELSEAGATPDDIPALYAFCQNQGWTGKFTPMALSSQWANFVAEKATVSASKDYLVDETGMIWHTYVPPPDYKPLFDYAEINRKFRESVGEIPTVSVEEAEKMTPEERSKNIRAMINNWAKNMEVTVTELDPDDPMSEVLRW